MKIYIDSGHRNNINDKGASFEGRYESDDTLAFGLKLGGYLHNMGHDIKYSRHNDLTVKPLNYRTYEANEWGADLYISIHRNACFNKNGFGTECLIYPNSKIKKLAIDLCEIMGRYFSNRGVKERSDLHVLKASKMPSLLLEIGFIDNEHDNLIYDKYKNVLAYELARKISIFKV